MKIKITLMISAFLILCLMIGCSNKDGFSLEESSESFNQISDYVNDNSTIINEDKKETAASNLSANNDVDVDLTVLSSTMVYSEVYNIVTNPDTYRGKTVKMKGLFNSFHDDVTGQDYFACLIQDAAACCSKGIEFKTTDNYSYPEDYPKDGNEITIVGTFDTYKEGQFEYAVLNNTVFIEE